MKRLIVIIIFSISWSFSVNAMDQTDTTRNDHLIVKTDIFFPIAYFISPDNTTLLLTLALEYRINNRFSLQLNASVFPKVGINEEGGEYFIVPEGRYFMKHHFVGLYTKAGFFKHHNYHPYYAGYSSDRYLAIGGLYGYQRTFGRINVEGRIGFGIAKEYYKRGPVGNGSIDFKDDDPYLDAILGINIGYRIF